MYCNKVRDMLFHKGFIFEEKEIPHGISLKFLGGLVLTVFNTGSIIFQGKINKNEALKKELQSILHI